MKRRITAFMMALIMLLTMQPFAYAADTGKQKEEEPSYYRLNVIKSNGITMATDFMIPADQSGVYINAEQIASLVGYDYGQSYEQCAFVDPATQHVVLFQFDTTQVAVHLMSTYIEYEAPLKSCYLNEVCWIPFDFAMTLFNASYYIAGDAMVVTPPTMSALLAVAAASTNKNILSFSWSDEIGYTEDEIATMAGSSRMVNFFSDILSGESHAWATLLTCLTDFSAYDAKYSKDVASLFISPSQAEIDGMSSYLSAVSDLLSPEGALAKALDAQGKALDLNVGSLAKACESLKSKGLTDAAKVMTYNRTYQQLDAAMDAQKAYRTATSLPNQVHKALNTTEIKKDFKTLEYALYGLDILNYADQFTNRDRTSMTALSQYCQKSAIKEGGTDAMAEQLSSIESSTEWGYAVGEFITEKWDTILVSKLPMHKILGAQANVLLVGWNLAANLIPFLREGLSSTRKFELAQYAIMYQEDSSAFQTEARYSCFMSEGINEKNLADAVSSTYTYLKFSCIARSAAATSLQGKVVSEEAKQILTERMNKTNAQIGGYLAVLSQAKFSTLGILDNSNGAYGFLPSENAGYLKKWDDTDVIAYLESGAGESIPESTQATIPVPEETPFFTELAELQKITEEEAAQMVYDALNRFLYGMMDSAFLQGAYEFTCVDSCQVEGVDTYVVQMTTYGQSDQYRFFVPYDGSRIWMGLIQDDGSYYCYTGLDVKTMDYGTLFSSLGDLYNLLLEEMAAQ